MSQKKAKGRGTMSRRIARMEAERRRAVRRRRLIRVAQIGLPMVVIGVGLIVFLVVRNGGESTAATTPTTTPISKDTVPTTTKPAILATVTSCDQISDTISGKPQFPTPP